MLTRIKQALCSHQVCWTDGKRLSPDLVRYPCRKCGKVLEAPYGLALNARWVEPTRQDIDRMFAAAGVSVPGHQTFSEKDADGR